MKHLELAKQYFETYGRPMIEKGFPDLKERYAAGLVGEGSGCFGFDDEFSRDHDFAPGFCIWLSDSDFEQYGEKLQQAYDALPYEFMGFSKENIIDESRMGVMKISDFYASFTGCSDIPGSNMDWFLISENNLASVTNGAVFEDKSGEFSRIRQGLLDFYPRDVLLKKLAARAAVISQSGQYNYGRCLKRRDKVASALCLARFAEAVISMVYLLNDKATPFYKWAFRGLADLPENENLNKLSDELKALLSGGPTAEAMLRTEAICGILINMLMEKGHVQFAGYFLQDYLPQLMGQIEDPELKIMHPMADCL